MMNILATRDTWHDLPPLAQIFVTLFLLSNLYFFVKLIRTRWYFLRLRNNGLVS